MGVNVEFGATTDKLQQGIEQAKDALESFNAPVDGLSSSLGKLTDAAGGTSSSLMILGGVGAAIAAGSIVAVFAEVLKLSKGMVDLERNAKETGLSLQQFQEYKYAASLGGVNDKQFLADLQTATGKLNDLAHGTSDLSKFLDANNVKYKQANGELISTDEYIQTAARLIANAATEGDKFKAAALLGFSRQWVEQLEKGPQALRATMAEADRTGAVLSDKVVHTAAQFQQEWDKTAVHWKETLQAAIISITPLFDTLIEKSKTFLDTATRWALENTHFGQTATPARGGQAVPSWFGVGEVPDHALPQMPVGTVQETAQAWMSVGGAIKQASAAAAQAAPTLKTAADSGNPAGGNAKTVFPSSDNDDATRAAQEHYRSMLETAQGAYNQIKLWNEQDVADHTKTYAQETADLQAALGERWAAEQAIFQRIAALWPEGTKQYEQALKDQNKAYQDFMRERQQLALEESKREDAIWKGAADQISGAFNSQLKGLLAGTTTWSKAMKSISADLVLKFIEDQIKLSVEFLAMQAKNLATHIAAEAGMTGATAAGTAARSAAEVASGETSILSVITNAMKAIFAGAGQTAAGVSANVAPEAGPAAPAIGAAAGAAVAATATGIAMFDVGTDYVLRSGLAVIHRGEQIKPAVGSGPYTGKNDQGGSSAIRSMLSAHMDTMKGMLGAHARSMASLESEVWQMRRQVARATR